ncbi:DUF3047 domain-containing protein [Halomonas sp.]|uniref:DUF3047 domain-containing protein n=1 Tax=Halomonas sp. TaxID=1486246 RepID=UPI000C927E75|nr:DUF3047 domain-containing protein [Halomonas sp.]MAR72828.1 hypothetical protein [Halomonas sp.]MBR9878354.1 DUF3047 domain-containing protein [Gammaproteobacteria bacterium]
MARILPLRHLAAPPPRTLTSALVSAAVLMASCAQAQAQTFSPRAMLDWPTKSFAGETAYRLVERDGVSVLEARSRGQASARYLERDIDLGETPYLRWCWQVSGVYSGVDERTESGDDYPARVYVARRTGLLPWQVESVNYVWSSNQPAGTSWPNAFTDRAVLLALQSGGAKAGQWVGEVRDVAADYRRLFGASPDGVDGLALMSDGDNAGGDATAWFSKMEFSASSSPPVCP